MNYGSPSCDNAQFVKDLDYDIINKCLHDTIVSNNVSNQNILQISIGKYEVNIDFDGASAAWKSNKKSIGNGEYKYICRLLEKVEQKENHLITLLK